MKRTPISPDFTQFPKEFHTILSGCPVFDSSCSQDARVYFLDRDGGLYLKTAPEGSLKTEADMNRFFHEKGLGPEVLSYLPGHRDWMLTRALPGEDCVFPAYLADPKRLCDTTATLLRRLHEEDASGCPVRDRNKTYQSLGQRNYQAGHYDSTLFPDHWGFSSAEDAWQEIQRNGKYLKADVLLHGDYCLPNILLDKWCFSGFLDLGNGGVGDRHIDLFWGVWTLFFNLKTSEFTDRFLDAYGRDKVTVEMLRTIAAFEAFR